MLAKDILKSARFILSDTASTRWTDERLLVLLNEGLIDIAKTTTLFLGDVFVGISNLVVDYDISDIAIKIERIEYLDKPLDVFTFEEMDAKCPGWQLETGDKPKAIIYNHKNEACWKIYPIVSNAENNHVVFTQIFGIVTDISYSDIEPILVNNYGDIGSLADTGYLRVYYVKKHAEVIDINTIISLSNAIKEPLAHYIAGRALRDNSDVQNRTVGNEELQFYAKGIEEYSLEKKGNFAKQIHQTTYRPGI